jgi:hypothetical protein
MSYYLGGKLIAQRAVLNSTSTATYAHQESLGPSAEGSCPPVSARWIPAFAGMGGGGGVSYGQNGKSFARS